MQGWVDIDRHCSKCAARAQGCISQGSRRSITSCAFGFAYVAMFVHNGQEYATRVYGIWSERLTSETASDRGRSLIFMFHYGFYAAPVYIKSTEMIATIPVAGRCTYLHHKRPHIQLLYTRIGAPSKRRAGFPCHEVITGRGARRTCSQLDDSISSTAPRVWPERTFRKWSILCRVGRKTLTQSCEKFQQVGIIMLFNYFDSTKILNRISRALMIPSRGRLHPFTHWRHPGRRADAGGCGSLCNFISAGTSAYEP